MNDNGINHSPEAIALVLAKSNVDLSDDAACVDVLVQNKMVPWLLPEGFCWVSVKIEAQHNRVVRNLNRVKGDSALAATAYSIVGGAALVACLASPAWAADGPLIPPGIGGVALAAIGVASLVLAVLPRGDA